MILALVQRSDSESSGQRSKIFGPPTLPWLSGAPGARGPGALHAIPNSNGNNIVTPSGSLQDTFLYLLVSNSAQIVRAQDKGARIFGITTVLVVVP